MDTESLAVSAVKTQLSKTDILSPFISEKDKEPCWDGSVYIYADTRKTKSNLKRVPVQVKGMAVNRRKVKEHISYTVDYTDLVAYLEDGGAIYFVVYIDSKTGDALQIYYTPLLPEKIKRFLGIEKRSYTFEFKKFPTDIKRIEDIFVSFHADSKKQVGFARKPVYSPFEIAQKPDFECFSLSVTSAHPIASISELPSLMEGMPLSVYGRLKTLDLPIPVQYIDEVRDIKIAEDISMLITVECVQYYDGVRRSYEKDGVVIYIGSCVKVTFLYDSEGRVKTHPQVEFKIKGTLSERIRGIEFFAAAIEHNGFDFGPCHLELNDVKSEFDGLENLKNVLESYRISKKMLDSLSVNKELEMDRFSENDMETLRNLIFCIGFGSTISGSAPETKRSSILRLGNLRLLVNYFMRDDGYIVVGTFSVHLIAKWRDPISHEEIRISQFTGLTADDFLGCDNVNLAFVIEDYQAIPEYERLYDHANQTALEFICAYDKSGNEAFLDASNALFNWIEKKNGLPEEILLVNRLQIVRRTRPLEYPEKRLLIKMIEELEDGPLKCCAFILLDEKKEAQQILDSFGPRELDFFKTFPIYKFLRDNQNGSVIA